MSKLQTALHALPPGSIVTKELRASTRELNARLDQAIQAETVAAKRVQQEKGCSWAEAVRTVVAQKYAAGCSCSTASRLNPGQRDAAAPGLVVLIF